jgi:3-methyl-2-oxobutanoate hydroxymethyltransferase
MGASTQVPMTAPRIRHSKGSGTPLVMVTAYDAPTARVVDAAGADMILVGDSVAMVVLGYDDTLQVTTDDMVHHVGAVARSRPNALIVGDLPWLSYHVSRDETVHNAAKLVRAGAGAVKLEGGRKRLGSVAAILDAEIPVMGHIGLTPQSIHALGGFKVQGKQMDAAQAIVDDAIALAEAGCFAIVLECVPDGVARMVTDSVDVPTIGIGAGRHCDGQVLVFHDLLGFAGADRATPKFVRRYASLEETATLAVAHFVADVRDGRYPSSEETYHMTDQMGDALHLYGGRSENGRSENGRSENSPPETASEATVSPPV